MSDNQEQIELETVDVEHHLLMGEALEALRKNPNFQMIIMDGYLKNKVLSSVSLLGVPQLTKSGERVGIMEDLVSASNLQYYFSQIDNFYEGCKNPILSDEEEEELLAEQNAEGTH